MANRTDEERDEIIDMFKQDVNMPAKELEHWLDTDESQSVGQKDSDGDESTGHASGRRIVTLLSTRKAEYNADDLDHMRKVSGYVHRHLAQRPDGDVSETPWRYSLMNWGHDPMKS